MQDYVPWEKKETSKMETRFPQLPSRKQIPDCKTGRRILNRAGPHRWYKGIAIRVWGNWGLCKAECQRGGCSAKSELERSSEMSPCVSGWGPFCTCIWGWRKKSFQAQKSYQEAIGLTMLRVIHTEPESFWFATSREDGMFVVLNWDPRRVML